MKINIIDTQWKHLYSLFAVHECHVNSLDSNIEFWMAHDTGIKPNILLYKSGK